MKHIFSKLAVIVLATSGAAAFAADNPATATFQVKMTILKACSVVAGAASDIQLGAPAGVDSTATNVQGSNAINVTCSKNTPYNIGLVLTSNSANTAGLGAMSGTGGNTDMVPYQLYSDAARTAVWGSTATGGALATVGNGVMAAIVVDSKEKVDRVYRKAIALGAQDEGPNGPRGENFYAGYFRDLDGNKLNVFYMGS